MSNVPESEWATVHTESTPLFRRWRTTLAYWARDGDGEVYIREQRDRLLPWRGRRVTVGFEGREVTG